MIVMCVGAEGLREMVRKRPSGSARALKGRAAKSLPSADLARCVMQRRTGLRELDCSFTAVKRKKQENYFKDKVFILILNKYSPGLLNFLELY